MTAADGRNHRTADTEHRTEHPTPAANGHPDELTRTAESQPNDPTPTAHRRPENPTRAAQGHAAAHRVARTRPRGAGAAVHAEWSKFRTVPAPGWLLLGLVAATVALGAVAANALECTSAGCAGDPVRSALTGVQLGQAVAAVLGVLMIGDEYGTGLIRTTMLAVPRRGRTLAAKAVVLTVPTVLAAAVAVAVGLVAGRILIAGHGPLAARGVDLVAPATLRAATGTVLYLALIALLGLGIAAAVRDTAVAIGITLGLLYLFPILAGVIGNPAWHRHLQQIGPSTAGLAIQTTVDVKALPIGPWSGLGVLALWSLAALVLGFTLLSLRDA